MNNNGVEHQAQEPSGDAREPGRDFWRRRKTMLVLLVLAVAAAIPVAQANTPQAKVARTLQAYAEAISAEDVAAVEKTVVATDELTVFEYAKPPFQPDLGWRAYRDNHLLPEFKVALSNEYAIDNVRVKVGGEMAYATFDYSVRMVGQIPGDVARTLGGHGFGTAVLVLREGSWRIQHLHTVAVEMKLLG